MSSTIVAQTPPAEQTLTLTAAVDLALRNHPAVREARAGSLAASQEIAVARTAYLPRADFLWQANRATRNNVFGLLLPQPVIPAVSGPVLGTETLDGVWSSAGGLLLSWEAVDFGRRAAGCQFGLGSRQLGACTKLVLNERAHGVREDLQALHVGTSGIERRVGGNHLQERIRGGARDI
jgi:hypothetical protein